MHPLSLKTKIVGTISKKLDPMLLKKAMLEKVWILFKSNGRARAEREQMPVHRNESYASGKNVEPDFIRGLPTFQDQIPTLAHELESACKDVEPEFIQLGGTLQAVYGDATKLTRQILDSVNLIGGKKEEGILHHLCRLAEASLIRLENCRKDLSEKMDKVQTVQKELDELSATFRQVEKISRVLSIVAVNIGIESARSEDRKELFCVVASDTAELSKRMKSISGQGMDVLKEAQDMLKPMSGELSKGLKEITGMGQHADVIVREIEALMTSTLQVAEQAGDHANRVSQQIGNLVVGVQFHDSMSQRVEHITKALADVEALLIEGSTGKCALALSIMKLQEAQLKQIIDEIHRVNEKGHHSFEEIITGFNTLLNHLSDLSASAEQGTGREKDLGSLERLRTSLSELESVLHRGEALMHSVGYAVSRVSDMVAQVSELVQDIHTFSFESHLMALNAIVKAAHLGSEGSALEVLAQEVKHSSNQSIAIMEKADDLLDVVTNAADRLRDQEGTAEADPALKDATSEMMREYNRFMEESAVAHKRADEIRDVVSESKAHLGFLPLLAQRFTACLNRLQAMVEELTPFASEDQSLSYDVVDDISKRYTMDKERQIHRATVSDNIDEREQWVTPEALRESPGQDVWTNEANSGQGTAGSIELFISHTASEAEETNESDDDFGDNVELF